VWEWHVWDHLVQDFDSTKDNYGVVADHPELMNVNWARDAGPDWLHANAVAYNAELDQIVISFRAIDEIWIIDHSTTKEEAAGHTGGLRGKGGDILYRWGNPQVYDHGGPEDQTLFGQHNPTWIPDGYPGEGNILVFNNGKSELGRGYSTVDELVPPTDGNGNYVRTPGEAFGPTAAVWTYDPTESFFAQFISGAQRLPNGNTLVCSGPQGRFFEVSHEGEILWEYINPVTSTGPLSQGSNPSGNGVFRCTRYCPDFAGFAGRDIVASSTLEIDEIEIAGTAHLPAEPYDMQSVSVTSTITDETERTSVQVFVDDGSGFVAHDMFDDGLHNDGAAGDDTYGATLPGYAEGTTVTYYLEAEDDLGRQQVDPSIAPEALYAFLVAPEPYVRGDTDGSGEIDIDDVVFLIAYIFQSGPEPDPIESGDADCGGYIDIDDAVYLIAYIFLGGPAPCPSGK